MPSAFQKAGLWVGAVALPVMAIICTHSMQMLVSNLSDVTHHQSILIILISSVIMELQLQLTQAAEIGTEFRISGVGLSPT